MGVKTTVGTLNKVGSWQDVVGGESVGDRTDREEKEDETVVSVGRTPVSHSSFDFWLRVFFKCQLYGHSLFWKVYQNTGISS